MTQATGTPSSTESTSASSSSSEYANSSMAMPMQMVEQPSTSPKPSSSEQYLGDLISGTYCSRIFSDCDRKKCRLQSPNFPGLYPRNLTCYYAVSPVGIFGWKLSKKLLVNHGIPNKDNPRGSGTFSGSSPYFPPFFFFPPKSEGDVAFFWGEVRMKR